MTSEPTTEPAPPIPDDDLRRSATIVTAESDQVAHLSLAGDTYTRLVTGDDTAGRMAKAGALAPKYATEFVRPA